MKRYSVAILFCYLAAIASSKADDFDPVNLFSKAFVPAMQGFDTTKTETFLRGFSLRGDSFPGMRADAETPSAYGIFLRVTIHDEGSQAHMRDTLTTKTHHDKMIGNNSYTFRSVTLPQHSANDSSLEMEFSFGSNASKAVVSAINTRIDSLLQPYK